MVHVAVSAILWRREASQWLVELDCARRPSQDVACRGLESCDGDFCHDGKRYNVNQLSEVLTFHLKMYSKGTPKRNVLCLPFLPLNRCVSVTTFQSNDICRRK